MEHRVEDLIDLFNDLFLKSFNTELIAGDQEPIYLPAQPPYREHNQIVFAHGFFASALHEIAHWCVAGPERRKLEDFGYWYQPDGRTAQQQQEFERVEVKPQAYEWILSRSAGKRFHFSADNLNGGTGPSEAFCQSVSELAQKTVSQGLSGRLAQLSSALRARYGVAQLTADQFSYESETFDSVTG